jgi:hypothetical protein
MNIKRSSALLISLLLTTAVLAQQPAFQIEPSIEKLRTHVSYLASDRLEGRRTGTIGANEAARYIAVEFSRLGLKPIVQTTTKKDDVSAYLQTFPYVARVTLGQGNALTISTLSKTLTVGSDWSPLGFSKSDRINATPTVFAGFGITSAELKYDDYFRGASGKVAVVFSGTPDGDNPHGQFARYEDPRFKAIAARNAGAAALVIISREKNFIDDRLSTPRYDNAGDAGIPVIVVSRDVGATLLEMANDEVMTRAETEMAKWARGGTNCSTPCGVTKNFNLEIKSTLTLATDVIRREASAYNVIAVLEGSDPKLKNETIIVGAHYDHLGRGGQGSLAQKEGEIHHGADDNASGVAGVLELARIFAMPPFRPKRTILFMAFSGEEEGLLGSNYYVNHPLLPLANTVAMINMDMIGRMKDRKIVIGGVGTAKEWRDIINDSNKAATMLVNVHATNPDSDTAPPNSNRLPGIPIVVSANGRTIVTASSESAFDLTLQEDGYGPSDHSSFYSKQIPVLFFWTGTHSDYHKPSDTFDKINYEDEARLLAFVTRIILGLDRDDKRLTFATAKSDATPRTGGFRVYLGTIPNYADSNDGLLLDGVREDSPAAKAGLKAGDKIVKIGSRDIKNVYDYTYALGELKAGQEYTVEVMRGTERLSLKITPEARK